MWIEKWSGRRDLNPRPFGPEAGLQGRPFLKPHNWLIINGLIIIYTHVAHFK